MKNDQIAAVPGDMPGGIDSFENFEPPTTIARSRRKRTLQVECDSFEEEKKYNTAIMGRVETPTAYG